MVEASLAAGAAAEARGTSGGLEAGTARSRALAMAVPGAPYVLRSGSQAALQQPTFELAKDIDDTIESLLSLSARRFTARWRTTHSAHGESVHLTPAAGKVLRPHTFTLGVGQRPTPKKNVYRT